MKAVTDYLEHSAGAYPDKVAFADERREITFSEIRNEAHKIAGGLIKKAFFKSPVAVYMDKCVECINAFMGVAYSGNFYTCIDVNMPQDRISKIMNKLEPKAVITDKAHEEAARAFADGKADVLLYENLMQGEVDEEIIKETGEKITETDVCYVLFTSGSTGTPKGVVISHRAITAYSEWLTEEFKIDSSTIFANQTPFYFVMSGLDIYQTLKNGATTYIVPKQLFSFPIMLLQYLKEKNVNTIYWVPSALCTVANFRAVPEIHLDKLKLIMFSGEVMPVKQLNMWMDEYPDATFVNHYGPTEMTDIIAFYRVDRRHENDEALPIGKACDHMDILLLDDNNLPVKDGEVGELCGRGPSLAYGYYNDPEKTAEAFVQNPFNKTYEEKIYRTGDLVKYNENGELIYISRKDFQIKHMGNRIELGEIETAVSSLDGIERNCCLYDMKRSKIVLFYTGNVEKEEITENLKSLLPDYMIPNKIKKLEEMPMNLNGKVDRTKLKEMI